MYVIPPRQIFDSACQLDDRGLEDLTNDLLQELEARRGASKRDTSPCRVRMTIIAQVMIDNRITLCKAIRTHVGCDLHTAMKLTEMGGTIEFEATPIAIRMLRMLPSFSIEELPPPSPAPIAT